MLQGEIGGITCFTYTLKLWFSQQCSYTGRFEVIGQLSRRPVYRLSIYTGCFNVELTKEFNFMLFCPLTLGHPVLYCFVHQLWDTLYFIVLSINFGTPCIILFCPLTLGHPVLYCFAHKFWYILYFIVLSINFGTPCIIWFCPLTLGYPVSYCFVHKFWDTL